MLALLLKHLLSSYCFRNVIWPLQGIRMFTYFRSRVWFGAAGLGPAQPYRQSSVSPVYLRVKVGNMVSVCRIHNKDIASQTIVDTKLVLHSSSESVYFCQSVSCHLCVLTHFSKYNYVLLYCWYIRYY